MSLPIVARIPEDLGKVLRYSAHNSMVVEAGTCEDCFEHPAVAVVKGEQDSFGWEPIVCCRACLDKMRGQVADHHQANDVEDREGHFIVSEGTNHDGHGDWFRRFTSYRAACGYYRQIEDAAAPWSGLYPNKGVREMSKEEADAVEARHRQAQKEQDEWEAKQDAEYEFRHGR